MCASFVSFLRSGPPPPKVALLPDALFFTRSIPITSGASATEAAAQVELALEAISPFPLAQLYYGSFWLPGAERAFVFAAYRRRFTADQTATWLDAEYVLPTSAALFGANVSPGTTIVLSALEGLTAVFWETATIPSRMVFRGLAPEATDEDRIRVREELLRAIGGGGTIIDVTVPPVANPANSDRELEFRSGDFVSRLPASAATALDVRDKDQLAAFHNARKRDVILWRTALGCAAAIVLLGLGQFGLMGGSTWQKSRLARLNARKPAVENIKASQNLANRIAELTTGRMLPFEMLSVVGSKNTAPVRSDILFTQMRTIDLLNLEVWVQTTNPAQITNYTTQLKTLPEIEDAVATFRNKQGDRSNYQLNVSFKPGLLKPQPLPGPT